MSSIHPYKQQRDEFQLFWGKPGDQLERVTWLVQRPSDLTGSELVQILTLESLEHARTSLHGFYRVADKLGIMLSEAGLLQRLNTMWNPSPLHREEASLLAKRGGRGWGQKYEIHEG